MLEAIKCPHCKHRLFDIEVEGKVTEEIKCPRCREIVKIEKRSKSRAKEM